MRLTQKSNTSLRPFRKTCWLPIATLMLTVIWALIYPSTANAISTDDGLSMVVAGSREDVLSVVKESMKAEFPKGVVTELALGIGYQVEFNGFWTGRTQIMARFRPLATGDEVDPSAYQLVFWYQVRGGDGMPHINGLKAKIIERSSKARNVTVVANASDYMIMRDQADRCLLKIENDSELRILQGKLAFDVDKQSFEMLANEAFPTEEESKAIYIYAKKKENCKKCFLAEKEFVPDNLVLPLYQVLMDSNEQLLVALYKGQISFGAYAKARREIVSKYEQAGMKIMDETREKTAEAKSRAEHLALEQQKVLAEEWQQISNNLKQAFQRPNAAITTCTTSVGGSVSCITR